MLEGKTNELKRHRAVSTECFCCPIRDKMLVATVIPKQYRAVGTACGIKSVHEKCNAHRIQYLLRLTLKYILRETI
jgi:hypothetical protein